MAKNGDPARYLLNVRVTSEVMQGMVFATGAVALLATGAAEALRDWTFILVGSAPGGAGVMAAVLAAALFAIGLPVSWWADFAVPRKVGLSRLTPLRFLALRARGLALSVPIGAFAATVLYALISAAPQWWWAWAAAAAALFSALFSWVGPVLLLPIFMRSHPMPPGRLLNRLNALLSRAGLSIKGVYVADYGSRTSTVNAFVTGLGNTRRITVSDTMLDGFTDAEVESVVAHEVAHHLNRDALWGMATYALLGLAAFWLADLGCRALSPTIGLDGPGDPAALPLLALLAGSLFAATSPLVNTMSRAAEYRADADSIRLTGDVKSYLSSTRKLIDENLSVEEPPRWMEVLFFDHPAYGRRLQLGDEWRIGHAERTGRAAEMGTTGRRR